MAIVGRALEGITCVAVTAAPPLALPEPSRIFALFETTDTTGARFLDDTALGVRVFTLPALSLRLIFEPSRIRAEALTPKKPTEFPLMTYLNTIIDAHYAQTPFLRYGFNYDIVYQYDAVIPQRQIMGAFLDPETVDRVGQFGWQCTLEKEKGKRKEQYFFKVISPLELRILANVEFDRPLPKRAQSEFEQGYTECQDIVSHVRFS